MRHSPGLNCIHDRILQKLNFRAGCDGEIKRSKQVDLLYFEKES